MGVPYAEVIGDPIAQSKSPRIHKSWLDELGLPGDYRATLVAAADLASYFEARRADPDWRGCNVTIPHKQSAMPLLDRIDAGAAAIGAVNCITPCPEGLIGHNTDIDGVAAALAGTPISGRKAVLIGLGGGARAAIRYLVDAGADPITLLLRDPEKANALGPADGRARIEAQLFSRADEALEGGSVIINATPLGMDGALPMPRSLLDAVAAHAHDATIFDMVYKPLQTEFLRAGQAGGGTTVDGLTMLTGQAREAFRHFFHHEAPPADAELRDLLTR